MGDASSAEQTASRLPWWKRTLFSAALTLGALALLELGLALAGVAPAYLDDDPLAGFAARIPHFVEQTDEDGVLRVHVVRSKRDEMNKQSFPVAKPAGGFRIFCLGGSTTYGHPFFDATSFCGWLRAFLPAADPSRSWEVVNAGAISYASYRITGVMRELLPYAPDLFVVYTGQNEFLERRTYEAILEAPMRTEAIALASRTRTVSLLRGLVRKLRPPPEAPEPEDLGLSEEVAVARFDAVGPEAFTRENTPREPVVRYFALALDGMVDLARSAGAGIVLVSPASNLAHFAPFKSQHRAGLPPDAQRRFDEELEAGRARQRAGDAAGALRAFAAAEAVDARHAALHFEKGRALLALGRTDEARAAFERALEEDVVPFRATAAIRRVMRDTAERRGVPWVDFEALVAERSPGGIPGEAYFFDHVHPTIEAHRLLALALVGRLVEAGIARPAPSWGDAAVAGVTAQVLGGVDRDLHASRLRRLAAMLERVGQPEQARKQAVAAVELSEGDPQDLYFAGALFQRQGRTQEAVAYLARAAAGMPDDPGPRLELGSALAAGGRTDEAESAFESALAVAPDLARAHALLGILLSGERRYEEAAVHLAAAAQLEATPDNQLNLGMVYVRLKRDEEAVRLLRPALRHRPESRQARFLYGVALERSGDRTGAAEQYRQILASAPGHGPSMRRLRALERAGL